MSPTAAPMLAVRGSGGIAFFHGPPTFTCAENAPLDPSKSCRTCMFSPDGQYFAWANGMCLQLYNVKTNKLVAQIARPKVFAISFSPQSTHLLTWEPFTVSIAHPEGTPNMAIFKAETGELVLELVYKKQMNWIPEWSLDETVCARMINQAVHFFEDGAFDRYVHKTTGLAINSITLSPSKKEHLHVVCYVPGGKDQPSKVMLFKYPNFQTNQVIATKSFFLADKVDYYWNKRGTSLLFLTSTEMDKTGTSYYGKQSLHYISTKGNTELVSLSKEGPIYDVQWSPKSTEFCVVFGYMPSKTTMFNLKCEPIYEFGAGPRNAIYFNPQGTALLLGGFGNLRGQIELYDTSTKKLIGKCDGADTTKLEWSPNGEHFVTATCSPRLRIGNGYKIWHYTGTLLFEKTYESPAELYEVCWEQFPPGQFPEKPLDGIAPAEGIVSSQPKASAQAYRPPNIRGRTTTFNLHDDDDEIVVSDGKTGFRNSGYKQKPPSNQKKKRVNKGANNKTAGVLGDGGDNKTNQVRSILGSNGETTQSKPLNEELAKKKKIKGIKKKLDDIAKLKQQQEEGKPLEVNQIAKLNNQAQLEGELKKLEM